MRVDCQRLSFVVVEDDVYMRRVLQAMLHGFGAGEIHEAVDGPAGLEMIRIHRPDIVLTDWELPGFSGLELARQLRDGAARNPFVPIVMITAHADKAHVVAARDAGINEYLVKPIDARRLYERILGIVVDQRPFIRTRTYFGPDRRRGQQAPYRGPERRRPATPSPRET